MAAAKGNGRELEFIYFSFPLSVIVAAKINFHTQVNENINWKVFFNQEMGNMKNSHTQKNQMCHFY